MNYSVAYIIEIITSPGGRSRAAATSKMESLVTIVNGFSC